MIRPGIVFQAEFDAEHDCIVAAYEITEHVHFCLTRVYLVISTNKLQRRDKSSQSHSHLGSWVWRAEVVRGKKQAEASALPD